MSLAVAFDALLAGLVLVVAGWVVLARTAFAATVGFVVYAGQTSGARIAGVGL